MGATITLGKHSSGLIKHISEVENGDKCNCRCIVCDEKLTAINNKNNKIEWHFRHKVDTDCNGGIETSLHLLAKQIITQNSRILISENEEFDYSKCETEVLLGDYQPDVIIENEENKKKWLVEIAVTNFIKKDKEEKIKKDNYNCLEIDLKTVDRNITPTELKEIVLNKIENRKIIFRKKFHKPIFFSHKFFLISFIVFVLVIIGIKRKK